MTGPLLTLGWQGGGIEKKVEKLKRETRASVSK